MPDPVSTENAAGIEDADSIRAACTRFLWGRYPTTPHQELAELAALTPADAEADIYGSGKLMADFEARVAGLLGKPAAVFMPSGTMAQQIALRIWADRTGRRAFACHPTCHLEMHEDWAYRTLHGLHAELVGNRHLLMTLDELQKVSIPLAALLLELPQRPIGGQLPPWDDLAAMTSWARERGIRLHMDGARLWESRPFYGRSYAEIAALFDTVYVSFYKILGGIAGAVLAGPEDVIAEARVWQHRHGGRIVHVYPLIFSAQRGLDLTLGRVEAYHAKAVEVAAALRGIEGVEIMPDPPHTNMMHVFMRADHDRLMKALLEIAAETKVLLMRDPGPCQIPAYQMTEMSISEAALDIPTAEIGALFADLMRRATRA